MAWKGYRSRLCKYNDFNVYGLFGRDKRLLSEYVCYYHEDRTHLGLGKGTPNSRIRSVASGRVLSQEQLGGLHHRYDRAA